MLSIDFCNEASTDLGLEYIGLCKEVGEKVLQVEGCSYNCEISLTITTNEIIHEINKEYREIDRPTDVLSFPAIDFPKEGDFSFVENKDYLFDLESGNLFLGDIIISAEKIASQSEEYGHSLKREYCFLVAHSMLHLLGYDHIIKEEANIMEEKQENVLSLLGISR